MISSIIIAFCICLVNIALALVSIRIGIRKKEWDKFIKIVLGSMVARYFLVIIALWYCLKIIKVEPLPFGLTFMITTFFLIMAEILYINYRAKFLNLHNTKIK